MSRPRTDETGEFDQQMGDGEVTAESGAQITVCPDGPLLVRGEFSVLDGTGNPIPRTRRTVALCRCGKSAAKPWCDGTHKVAGFTAQ